MLPPTGLFIKCNSAKTCNPLDGQQVAALRQVESCQVNEKTEREGKRGGGGGKDWGQCWGEGWKGQNTVFISCYKIFIVPSHKPNWPSQWFERTLQRLLGWVLDCDTILLAPAIFIRDSAKLRCTNRLRHLHHRWHHPWSKREMNTWKRVEDGEKVYSNRSQTVSFLLFPGF